jgi:hypothetical protein
MSDLLMWYCSNGKKPEGIPKNDDMWLREKFYPKKEQEGMSYPWVRFAGNQTANDLDFPSELFLIIQKQKKILFDFLPYRGNVFLVSELFLDFLVKQNLNANFEISKLKVVHKNELELKFDKKYFAIRIFKFDDELFDFVEDGKKRASGLKDVFMYPNLTLKEENKRDVFFLKQFCYLESVIISERIQNQIKEIFYRPELYYVFDFPLVYNNQSKIEFIPDSI